VAELRVALTFDAEHPSRSHCPPEATERILSALFDAGIRATFFVQGRWASAYPERARAVADHGHLVGNHSHYHARFSFLSPKGIREDLARAEAAIVETAGVDPKPWFRLPFGDGDGDVSLAEVLASVGYHHEGWDVDPNDWDPARSPGDVEQDVVEGVLAVGDGAIVLLHAWPTTTVEALPHILHRLRAEGAEFVGLDERAGTRA
jgi:peptidoglycan-N-acetylglucosamine deacetylase